MWRIGVDVGGTKIEAVALSPEQAEHNRLRIPTPRDDYKATIDAIAGLVQKTVEGLPPEAIIGAGVGIPGSLSPRFGLVRNANSTWLNGRPFGRDIQARLPWPVVVENDANCFALSEATDGAAQSYATVFGIILGTGVGGGLVVSGRSLNGRNAIGGEWGHNPLPWQDETEWPGLACYCGKRGCIETFLSGPALEAQYEALAGSRIGAKDIAELAARGDDHACRIMEIYVRRLAKALATVVNIVDPDIIVFGGGMSNIPDLIDRVRAEMGRWVFSDCFNTDLKRHKWGDSSGVRGAARLAGP